MTITCSCKPSPVTALQPPPPIYRPQIESVREAAWRDGWQECKDRLTEDEAFCLTEDVEEDAWLDSATAALEQSPSPVVGEK